MKKRILLFLFLMAVFTVASAQSQKQQSAEERAKRELSSLQAKLKCDDSQNKNL